MFALNSNLCGVGWAIINITNSKKLGKVRGSIAFHSKRSLSKQIVDISCLNK